MGAVAAVFAHVVDDEQVVVLSEKVGEGFDAVQSFKLVVMDLLGWILLASFGEFLFQLIDLSFEFCDC